MARKKEKVVKEYSAVLFKADDENDEPTEVAVVPSNWIVKEGREKFCYWPNDDLLDNVAELYNNCAEPPVDHEDEIKKWDKFGVKVEEGPYPYKQASEHARRMGDPNREDGKTTDYEGEDGKRVPRKRKQPDRFTAIMETKKTKKNEDDSLSANQMFEINPEDESDEEPDSSRKVEEENESSDQSINELPTLESTPKPWQIPKDVRKKIDKNQKAASSQASSSSATKAAAPKKTKTGHLTPSQRNIPLNEGLSKKGKKTEVIAAVQNPVKNVETKKSRASSKKFTPNPPKPVKKPPFEFGFSTSGYSAVHGYRIPKKSKSSTPTTVEVDLISSSEEDNTDEEEDDDDDNDLADFKTPPPSQKSKLKSGNAPQSKIVAIKRTGGMKREKPPVGERSSQISVSSFSSTSSTTNVSKGEDNSSQMTESQNYEESHDVMEDKRLDLEDKHEPRSKKETSLQSAIKSKNSDSIIIEVAKALQRIERRLYSLGDSQKILATKLNDLQMSMPNQQLDPGSWNFSLPLKSSQELEEMNRRIREDRSIRSEVFRQCRVLTGTTVSRVTINVMRKLLTSSLGSLYNWKPEGSTTSTPTAEEANDISFQIFDEVILMISDIVVSRFQSLDEQTFANQFNDGMRTVLKNMRRDSKKPKDDDSKTEKKDGKKPSEEDDSDDSKTEKKDEKKPSEEDDSDDSDKTIKVNLRKNCGSKNNDD